MTRPKEIASSKASLIRNSTTIALMLSALALGVVWIGAPGLLIATRSMPGQHPQLSKELTVSIYTAALTLGLGIPYALITAVVTMRSPTVSVHSARCRAELVLFLTSLVYLNLVALSVVNVAFDVSPDVFASTWRLLTPMLLLGWLGIVLIEARLIIRLQERLARPRVLSPSQEKKTPPSLARQLLYRRTAVAAVVFAGFALIAQSVFAVGAILLLMGTYLIVVPQPTRFAPSWTQRPRVRAFSTTARIVLSGLLLIVGSYAYGYSIIMAVLTTACFFDESALGKFHFYVSPISLVVFFGLVFSPLILIGTGYFVLGVKVARSRWNDASDLLFFVGVGSILVGIPIATLTREDVDLRPFFIGGILLTAFAMFVDGSKEEKLAGRQ